MFGLFFGGFVCCFGVCVVVGVFLGRLFFCLGVCLGVGDGVVVIVKFLANRFLLVFYTGSGLDTMKSQKEQ